MPKFRFHNSHTESALIDNPRARDQGRGEKKKKKKSGKKKKRRRRPAPTLNKSLRNIGSKRKKSVGKKEGKRGKRRKRRKRKSLGSMRADPPFNVLSTNNISKALYKRQEKRKKERKTRSEGGKKKKKKKKTRHSRT